MAKKEILTSLTAVAILYAMAILYEGYHYGEGDQTQILPCIWAQDHPGTYVTDHYVQHYLSSGTNERTIFHFLLRHMGYDQPWLVWIWHAVSALTIFLALIAIASIFIKNKVWQWLVVAIIITVASQTSTGSNELYYNLFIPSLPAIACALWALYYWYNEKYLGWALLMILSGYLQPLVGFQLFLLTTAALIIERWQSGTLRDLPWRAILIYSLFTLPWIFLLATNNGSGQDKKTFMDIMEFRLSHHFFASYFGKIHLLLGIGFAIITGWYYHGRLKWMMILIVTGCLVYEAGVEWLRMPVFLYTQWWKTTIWMEAFAVIAIISQFEKITWLTNIVSRLHLLAPICLLIIVGFYRLSGIFGEKPVYMLPWTKMKTDEVEISEIAQQLTPQNSVFIIPPELTAFRWYSKRGTYVDYKAMIHNETFLKDWYNRIYQIYGYDLELKKSGIRFNQKANEALNSPSPETVSKWKSLGISYLISSSPGISDLQFVAGNQKFSLYKIP